MRRASALLLLVAGLAWGPAAPCADAAREWLARMEQALATRNYQGTFVHEHDGQTETLRVVHRTAGGEVRERIVSLDGSGREFIRRDAELSTYFPDQRAVLLENGAGDGLLLAQLRRLDTAGAQFYQLRELAPVRVSGRDARVVAVEPLDDLRYGYQVWIDAASGMPLKTQQRDGSGRVTEQLVFTELTLPAHIPDSALQPSFDVRDWRVVREQPAQPQSTPLADWPAIDLPPGFRLTAHTRQVLAGTGAEVTHLVFSDGLASVSVFLEPQAAGDGGYVESLTRLGSSSALATAAQGLKITAIGEVPARTVRAIASALRVGVLGAGPGLPGGRGEARYADAGRAVAPPRAASAAAAETPSLPGVPRATLAPGRPGGAAPGGSQR